MKNYLQIEPDGRVIASLQTVADLSGVPGMIEGNESEVGKRYKNGVFVAIEKTKKEKAADRLRKIDEETGMTRMMRETLLAIAGVNAPIALVEKEAEAELERVNLK